MVIVLQATSIETPKAQSKTNHTLLTPVVEAQTLPVPSASAHVLFSPSSLSAVLFLDLRASSAVYFEQIRINFCFVFQFLKIGVVSVTNFSFMRFRSDAI